MAGACEARASCDGAHTLENPDGTREDCQPYRCTNEGTCLEACSTTSDCVTPHVCSPSGECVRADDSAGSAEEDSGCALARGSALGENRAWTFALIVLAALVRRRR